MSNLDTPGEVKRAYRIMAKAGYRPAAPSDGFGKIVGPLDLKVECNSYAEMWLESTQNGRKHEYWIGTPYPENLVVMVLAVEAARLLCGTRDTRLAHGLLKRAWVILDNNHKHCSEAEAVPGARPADSSFPDESEMQRAVRADIGLLESGLKVIDGGKEKHVQSGRIDILAEDIAQCLVVIELKTGEAEREAVSQISSYMGEMANNGKQVRGILVAESFSLQAQSAASCVPNLQLRECRFELTFGRPGSPT